MFNTGIVVWLRKLLGIRPSQPLPHIALRMPLRAIEPARVLRLRLDPQTVRWSSDASSYDYVDASGNWWRCFLRDAEGKWVVPEATALESLQLVRTLTGAEAFLRQRVTHMPAKPFSTQQVTA